MANLASFKPPELYKKKQSEVKYLFTFELRKSITSRAHRKNFVENYYFDRRKLTDSKNYTEHNYFVFFESQNHKNEHWIRVDFFVVQLFQIG